MLFEERKVLFWNKWPSPCYCPLWQIPVAFTLPALEAGRGLRKSPAVGLPTARCPDLPACHWALSKLALHYSGLSAERTQGTNDWDLRKPSYLFSGSTRCSSREFGIRTGTTNEQFYWNFRRVVPVSCLLPHAGVFLCLLFDHEGGRNMSPLKFAWFYGMFQSYIPEDWILYSHYCESLISDIA
jgi:hypothetical protein